MLMILHMTSEAFSDFYIDVKSNINLMSSSCRLMSIKVSMVELAIKVVCDVHQIYAISFQPKMKKVQ